MLKFEILKKLKLYFIPTKYYCSCGNIVKARFKDYKKMFIECSKCGSMVKYKSDRFNQELFTDGIIFQPFKDVSKGKNAWITSKRQIKEREAQGDILVSDSEAKQIAESNKKAREKEDNEKYQKDLSWYAHQLSSERSILQDNGKIIPPPWKRG